MGEQRCTTALPRPLPNTSVRPWTRTSRTDSGADRGPYFTSLNLTDPAAMVSSNTIFTGIPAGVTDVLMRTNFKPELAVSNFSAKLAQVSVTMARTSSGKTDATVVQKLLLPPQSSRTVKLPAQGDSAMTNSLVVHSNLPPGEVVSQFVVAPKLVIRAL